MYLEQETKEAYLRAILCDPPEVIEQKDNDELGILTSSASPVNNIRNTQRSCKSEIEGEEATSRRLVRRSLRTRQRSRQRYTLLPHYRTTNSKEYTYLSDKSTEATRQLAEIEQMKFTITDLKNAQEQDNTDQNLPLPASLALLSRHKAKRDHLAIALEKQTQENARKRREVEKLRVQLEELERNRVDVEMFAREAEKSQSAESAQEEMACKKQVGWWYVPGWLLGVDRRLKAMTAAQMEFLGLTEFSLDERTEVVRMVLYVNNVGDVPIQIQLKDRKFDSAKVISHFVDLTIRLRIKHRCESMIS